MNKKLREASRIDWTSNDPPTESQINIGSLQRIADATELMSRRYQELLDSREYWQNYAKRQEEYRATADRRIAALKGQITKLKKAAKQ